MSNQMGATTAPLFRSKFETVLAAMLWVLLTAVGYAAFYELHLSVPSDWKSDVVFSESAPGLAAQLLAAESAPEKSTVTVRFIDQGPGETFVSSPEYVTKEQVDSTFISLPDGRKKRLLRLEAATPIQDHESKHILIFEPIANFDAVDKFTLSLPNPWGPVPAQRFHVPWYQTYSQATAAIIMIPVLSGLFVLLFFALTAEGSFPGRPTKGHVVTNKSEVNMPNEWNDDLITRQILSLRERPNLLAHFVNSLMGRFILGQNDKTAEKRTKLIRTVIGQLKATKELRVAIDDLDIHSLEREIRFIQQEIEHAGVVDRRARQQELEELKRKKEKLELEVQIAKLEQEKRGYEPNAETKKPGQSRDELREAKKAEIKQTDKEMAEAIFEVNCGKAFDELSEDQQERIIRLQNYYNDKKARLDEELSRI